MASSGVGSSRTLPAVPTAATAAVTPNPEAVDLAAVSCASLLFRYHWKQTNWKLQPLFLEWTWTFVIASRGSFGFCRYQSFHNDQQRGQSNVPRHDKRYSALGNTCCTGSCRWCSADDAEENGQCGKRHAATSASQQTHHPTQEIFYFHHVIVVWSSRLCAS